MPWLIKIAHRAQKELEKLPDKESERMMVALREIKGDPFSGDLVKLKSGGVAGWRRRVGNYRIFFDIYPNQRLVDIVDIKRRTSSTY